LITWMNRVVRVRVGGITRLLRSSNVYTLIDPNPAAAAAAVASKSDPAHSTRIPVFTSVFGPSFEGGKRDTPLARPELGPDEPLFAELMTVGRAPLAAQPTR
jgi:hypothetical protein